MRLSILGGPRILDGRFVLAGTIDKTETRLFLSREAPPRHRVTRRVEAARVRRREDGDGAYAPLSSAKRHTGMPSLRALSTRLAAMPDPGKATRPAGSVSSIASLRLKGAAF